MAERVKRLRPRHYDTVTESIRLILDMPLELSQEARNSLNDALGKFAPSETWGFVMLNPEQQRLVLRAINRGEKPALTLRIWLAAISHIRYDGTVNPTGLRTKFGNFRHGSGRYG